MADPQPFLVYRDRIGVASEIGFLRRQYVAFTRLRPIWTGRVILADAPRFSEHPVRLGGDGPLGPLRRLLFRHFGRVPDLPRASILHAQFARGGALALPIAQALDMRLFVTLHGGDVAKRKNWRDGSLLAQRWPALIRQTERFICVSAAVAAIAAEHGVPEGKLTVLPIGVEIPPRPPPRHPTSHLFVGRFVEKKGIQVLADAMRLLRAQGDLTPLTCVGDGRLRPLLASLARDIPGITLTGWLSPDAVRDRMSSAFSLIVPSIVAADGDAEGLPSVIGEAMAQACPVIGTDRGGIAEAIRHGETGLLVLEADPQSLADAMRRVLTDTTIGLAGYRHASAALNAAVQSAKLESLLLAR